MKVELHWTNRAKGLYIIKNDITNQIYVGSTRNTLYNRLSETLRLLKRGDYHNIKLQRSFNKYGEAAFSWKYKIIKNKDDHYILKMEERFISIFKPYFNICLYPTLGGKPNLGRKLNDEWINNLNKNKNYKHSEEMLEYISQNNKNNVCKLEFINDYFILNFNSWVEAVQYFNVSSSSIQNGYLRYGKWKNYKINKLNSQAKKIKLYFKEEVLFFNSASECDRFLNMWRGATSHYLLRDGKINGFKIEYID